MDTEFITDRFNLTGLNAEVSEMQECINIITDAYDDPERDNGSALERMSEHLYGLIHARYILTTRGLQKMLEKYKNCDFGRCPRVLCHLHPLLPIGLHDTARMSTVKLYCAKCEDIYTPKSSRHASIDSAYFGTTFPGMLFQMFPQVLPNRSNERYVTKIFGFQVHEHAKLARWQDRKRLEMEKRLLDAGANGAASGSSSAATATQAGNTADVTGNTTANNK